MCITQFAFWIRNQRHRLGGINPRGHGAGTHRLLDADRVLAAVGIQQGDTVLDAGAGYGYFSLAAARMVGEHGRVYAVDAAPEAIDELRSRAEAEGLRNIVPILANLGESVPLPDGVIDVCLMSNVLHDLVVTKEAEGALREVARLLRPGGTLALVEFKKMPDTAGPPTSIRLTPDDAQTFVSRFGFSGRRRLEVGPHHYMILFEKIA